MNHNYLKPRQALNKAFLKVKPVRTQIEVFKDNLIRLLDQINESESEEFHKNLVSDFLKRTYYEPDFSINTKGRNDMVIHNGKDGKSPVGVILETKKPTNKSEMISFSKAKIITQQASSEDSTLTPRPPLPNGQGEENQHQTLSAESSPLPRGEGLGVRVNLNVKSFQELVLYFLRERITQNNLELKYLVVTNIYEWFVFDASVFEKAFAQNKNLVKDFKAFEAGSLSGTTTDFFYKEIAAREIDKLEGELAFTYFDLRTYDKPLRNADKKDDVKLIALFKLLSPEHMLKLPFTNDSNSLDKRFYSELLHIIGLSETKEGGKKLIGRNKPGERHAGSILENAIVELDSLDKISRLERPSQYGNTNDERLFNVALELSITWVNRILFLKLLEAQLITYHKGDKSYSFLNLDKIKNYDDLNSLFFKVLARKYEDRSEEIIKVFGNVPYLNSSLFEPTDMEHDTLFISNLRDEKTVPIISSTVLKNEQGKKRTGNLSTLEYLFEFLNAYDFSSEGSEDIQEDNKTLINASVLGLIFEKINGYKDGSFFTPGFITMYMCRETIRRAVVQKFREAVNNTLTPQPPLPNGEGVKVPSPSGRGDLGVRDIELQGKKVDPKILAFARSNRKDATQAESFLWEILRNRKLNGLKFRRQHPVEDKYVLDFYCAEFKLVVEIDGGYHESLDQKEYDEDRTYELNELGLTVLRFSNEEVLFETERVLQEILDRTLTIQTSPEDTTLTPRPPLPHGEGEDSQQQTTVSSEKVPSPSGRGDLGVSVENLDDVYDLIGPGGRFSYKEANDIVNSIKICDPAVGSGHFLVSALNEMIAVKNDLKILQDRNGRRLKEYQVEVVNDELVITDEEGQLFEYNPNNKESQRIQETLFHEKQTIIENCLFGVDINPNSVKICRLRLWIELLKNAYYKTINPENTLTPRPPLPKGEGEKVPSPSGRGDLGVREMRALETLPNIDINIKCGNSLVSRFAIDADLSEALKKSKFSIDSYRMAVTTYRNAQSKEEKREMERLIAEIKSDFRSEIANNDPKIKRKAKLGGELYNLTMQTGLFEVSAKEKKERKKKVEKIEAELEKLSTEIEEIKNNKIYENAFEWRFEFPEVLNESGDFVGFDVVIGNPPYFSMSKLKEQGEYFSRAGFETYSKGADIYCLFYELGGRILKHEGFITYITSNSWLRAIYGGLLKAYFMKSLQPISLLNIEDIQVFEEATVESNIITLQKRKLTHSFMVVNLGSDYTLGASLSDYFDSNHFEFSVPDTSEWFIGNQVEGLLKAKIETQGKQLKEYDVRINFGIKTGYNAAFIIDQNKKDELINLDSKNVEIIKPILRGRDLKKYSYDFENVYLINSHNGLKSIGLKRIELENEYPAIFDHLKTFSPQVEKRYDQGDHWSNLRNCAYLEEFEKPKIVWGEISDKPKFAFDDSGYYAEATTFLMTGEKLKFLLAILNSKVSEWYFNLIGTTTGMGTNRWKKYKIELLPIKVPTKGQELQIENLVDQILEAKRVSTNADTSNLEYQIDQLVYEMYGLMEEEIRIVEGGDG
ncbi:MAG: type IIG restriction enzyme/methyltransferase [Cecembia sp.]